MRSVEPIICRALFLLTSILFLWPAARADVFSIVVVPDTQWYAENNPQIIDAQMQWIVDNRVTENIAYVVHLGDLKDDTSCDVKTLPTSIDPAGRTEWEVVEDAFALLEDPVTTGLADGIPYGVSPGNHDFDQFSGGCPDYDMNRPLDGYDAIFGPSEFAGRAYYGGSFPPLSNENNYSLFSAGGTDFIVINLAYRENAVSVPPGDPALAWADGLLSSNPDRLAIVTTHFILEEHSIATPTSFGSFGASIYDALDANPNLFLMLSAHRRGEAWRVEPRAGMDDVNILLSNYQDILYPGAGVVDFTDLAASQPGDSGFMRIMRFDTDTGMVDVETFAPPVSGLGRPLIVSTEFVPDGNLMYARSASNFSFAYPAPVVRPSAPILLDTSGSMAWSVDGDAGVPVDQQRITYAKQAAKAFLDLMVAVPENEGEADFAIATFPDHPSSPCSMPNGEVVTALTNANNANIAAATGAGGTIDSSPDLVTQNSTPMLAGLETVIGMFGPTDLNRNVILLGDGYHNCPGTVTSTDAVVDTLISDLNAEDIRVFVVGFGEPGDVDNLLHRRLANDTTPAGASSQFYDVTGDLGYDPTLPSTWSSIAKPALDLAFKEILGSVMGLETAVDPVGSIEGGTQKTIDVAVNELDQKLGVFLSWQTLQPNRLSLSLYDSSGEQVDASHRGVRFVSGDTYSILSVDGNYLSEAGRVSTTPWRLVVDAGQLDHRDRESFQYSVLLDSKLKFHAKTIGKNFAAGDTIELSAELIEDGRRLRGSSGIDVQISSPDDGRGNWLALNTVSPEQLAMIPERKGGEPLSAFQRKSEYLNAVAKVPFPQRSGNTRLTLVDDGTNGDKAANDGRYTARFSGTAKEGIYGFYFRAVGASTTGTPYTREKLVQTYLSIRPEPATIFLTATDLKPGDLRRVEISITPKDALGNYLGPGNAGLIQLSSRIGRLTGELRDNLDGSYAQTIELPTGSSDRDVELSVAVAGVTINTNLATIRESGGGGVEKRKGFWWVLLVILIAASLA